MLQNGLISPLKVVPNEAAVGSWGEYTLLGPPPDPPKGTKRSRQKCFFWWFPAVVGP